MSRAGHEDRVRAALAASAVAKVQYPIRIRELTVLRRTQLTPRMLRLTLGGPELAGFESHVPVEHVRLVLGPDLPVPDGDVLRWPRPFPPSREYTVRRHDPVALELDLDVVIHGGGLISGWAEQAEPGDRIPVAGPPGGLVIPEDADPYLLAGDETALPAIARWLERAAAGTRGWALLDIADDGERQPLNAPGGVEVTWLSRDGGPSRLAEAVRTTRPAFVWAAGEAGAVQPIRRWARDELGLPAGAVSVSGYWKRGVGNFRDDH